MAAPGSQNPQDPEGLFAALPDTASLTNFLQRKAAGGDAQYAWAAVPGPIRFSYFNPATAPFRGMYSALTGSALKPGQWTLSTNIRPDDSSIMVRWPTTDVSATGLGSATGFRGAWSGILNGTAYVIAAFADGTKVRLYKSTDGIAYTEITAASGTYGNTRMTDTGIPFRFQPFTWSVTPTIAWSVSGNASTDYLVIQNGTDSPRIFRTTQVNSSYVIPNTPIGQPPISATSLQVQPGMDPVNFVSFFASAAATWGPTFTNSGGNFALAKVDVTYNASNFGSYYTLTINNSVAVNDTALMTWATGVLSTSNGPTQLVFAADHGTYDQWSKIKVEVRTGSTFTTIYDPTISSYLPPYQVPWSDSNFDNSTAAGMGLAGESLVAYDITSLGSSYSINGIRLTWKGPTVQGATTYTVDIHGIFLSGSLPYGVLFGEAAWNSGGLAEGAFVALRPPSIGSNVGTIINTGPAGNTVGIATGPSSVAGSFAYNIHLPYGDNGIQYNYTIPTYTVATADVNSGVDFINIYSQMPGQTDYFWVRGPAVNSGSFVITAAYPQNIAWPAGDSFSTTIPTGNPMCYANQRLFVGNGQVYNFSETATPWRNRPVIKITNNQPLARSAGTVTLGAEQIAAFSTAAASPLGSSTVFVQTNLNTYSTGGFSSFSLSQPTLTAAVGNAVGLSTQQYRDAIFFLDNNGEIRRFSYGRAGLYVYENANAYDLMTPISRRVVDNYTRNIPASRVKWTSGLAIYDRYYLAFTPQGQTVNTNILVWDETMNLFVMDTMPGNVGAEGIVYAPFSTGGKILIFGSDLKVYQHENTSSNATLQVQLTTLERHDMMWNNLVFGSFGIVCDVQSGQTATITRTMKIGSLGINRGLPVMATSYMDLANNATNQIWRWDHFLDVNNNVVPAGTQGASQAVNFTATMNPGTRIYSIIQELEPSSEGQDR